MRTLLSIVLMLSMAGCGGRSVGLVDLGPADAEIAGDAQPPSNTCRGSNDCPQGSYCRLASCGASQGRCEPRPTSCPTAAAPPPRVCGCDGTTYAGGCEAARVGVSVAHQGSCTSDPACEGVSCGVLNTCCDCRAYDMASPPEPLDCPAICEAPQCTALGIQAPFGYCLGGRCLLGAGASCSADADCGLVNDCCACMALPAAVAKNVEYQCAADCFQPACDGIGLGSAVARCLGGRCRVALP